MEITGATTLAAGQDALPLPGCRVLRVRGQGVPKTGLFKYLGSFISIDETLGTSADVAQRVGLAQAAFCRLRHVWNAIHRNYRTNARLLRQSFCSSALTQTPEP